MDQNQKNKYPILSGIASPADLKLLSDEDTDSLADEIRECLVERVSENGGHLASNLGVVELTLALHRVFDAPDDKIVFDVGHQSYVHKLLTGRFDSFDTLRRPGGISGFTKRSESVYDPFGAGHSSTALSAALGIAEAEKLSGSGNWTVAVIGDGAFTGGMVHEALNNCPQAGDLKLLIVINENEMSISKNIGSFARSLSNIRTTPGYFRTKLVTRKILSAIPLIGKPVLRFLTAFKKKLKDGLYGSNLFEDLGLYYVGPVDGNDRRKLETAFREAVKHGESAVIHVKTVKGKGYPPAEKNPGEWHSVPAAGFSGTNGFSAEFGEALCKAATVDGTVCAVTAAMEKGTSLDKFHRMFPERFFDVGIAEAHAVTFASGLASDGMKPVCAIYSTFLQRAYDSILHDAALQGLPLTLCIDRAGLNETDGATHHGIFDVAFLSSIPGVEIFAPATYDSLRASLRAALASGTTAAVRYPNGSEDPRVVSEFYPDGFRSLSGVRFSRLDGAGIVIVCHGRMASVAVEAADRLKAAGIGCGLALCELIKPYSVPAELIVKKLPPNVRRIVFIEEEIKQGGFGMNLSDAVRDAADRDRFTCTVIGTDDTFAVPKSGMTAARAAGVDVDSILRKIMPLVTRDR
ncbi:MAG: 1-deoxy-D-xylulose-5-phosphate synthase [Clostridia bacterium]|nr:1-deoxy-D-xylulose-5-phosphate synthase [Clostridia bacterium]